MHGIKSLRQLPQTFIIGKRCPVSQSFLMRPNPLPLFGQLGCIVSRSNRSMVALTLIAYGLATVQTGTSFAYSGEPILNSPSAYRVLTFGVTVNLNGSAKGRGSAGTATVDSTTVYRNQGEAGTASLVIPQLQSGPAALDLGIVATWDGKPVTLTTQPGSPSGGAVESDLTASVALRTQGTHALRIHYVMPLQKIGYSGNRLKGVYLLNSKQPLGLFTFAFKYTPQVVFNLPNLKPNLGWQSALTGSAVRKVNFTPPDEPASIEFYPNGFAPIGQ